VDERRPTRVQSELELLTKQIKLIKYCDTIGRHNSHIHLALKSNNTPNFTFSDNYFNQSKASYLVSFFNFIFFLTLMLGITVTSLKILVSFFCQKDALKIN